MFLRKTMTDLLTVYNDDRLVYSLKDGTEITIELGEKIEKSPNSTWTVLFGEFGGCSYFGVERCMKSWYNKCYTITANKVEKVPSGFAIILA